MAAGPTTSQNGDAQQSPAREVVITGFGVVSPIGIGKDAYWSSLIEQRSGIRDVTGFDVSTSRCKIAGEVLNFNPKQYVRPRKSLKVMSRDIQLGFAAAELATSDSGLGPDDVDPERKAVIFAADLIYADLESLEAAYRSCMVDGVFDFSRWGEHALSNMQPLWMLKYLPNMPACHIGIAQDARGPNNSITAGDASSLQALAEAIRVIQRGNADVVISGGTSSQINPTVYDFRGRGRFTSREGDPTVACRPFDLDRDGMVHGEGAAAFVLESREHAERRGATIHARLLGSSSRFEPIQAGKPLSGVAIKNGIVTALQSAGISPDEVDHVNAHGIATIEGDRAEAGAIHQTLGDVAVIAPKSYFGNLGAGAGAVEMVVSILAMNQGLLPTSLNFDRPDPECPVNVVHGEARSVDKQAVLLLNQGRAGQAMAVVMASP